MSYRKVPITDEMFQRASVEQEKRDPFINHHFEVEHLSGEERDIIGFLGEFACCELLGIDWRSNIRDNYYSIDNGDITLSGYVFDVKTETLPTRYLKKIENGKLSDNEAFGRRLINGDQVKLLGKYNAVIFGAFIREECENGKCPLHWYALGYASVQKDLNGYSVTSKRPDGGDYPTPVLPFRSSQLRSIDTFIDWAKPIVKQMNNT